MTAALRGALLCALLLSACATTDTGSATPSPPPTSSASSSPTVAGVVVTIRVVDEEYRILLTDPVDVAIARRLLAGGEAPRIPNGVIVRGSDGGVNTGYSWYIDPDSLEFAEVTTEVCDGLPSYVEDGSLSGDRFCPWAAEVIAIEE